MRCATGACVAVAVTRLRDRSAIRAAMARVVAARASQAPRTFVGNASGTTASLTGRTLAGTGASGTDAALTLLCSLLSA